MSRIKESKNKPKYIQTDAAEFYPSAFRKVFAYHKIRNNEVEHRINNVSKTKKHNVRIETVFSKIKDRVYDFRGLKALWSAPILMAGIVLQHNFIESHTTTGVVPCELANLKLDVDVNRWLGLIKLSSK
jgi:transposase-like protein